LDDDWSGDLRSRHVGPGTPDFRTKLAKNPQWLPFAGDGLGHKLNATAIPSKKLFENVL
jgi:hypothetical protein